LIHDRKLVEFGFRNEVKLDFLRELRKGLNVGNKEN